MYPEDDYVQLSALQHFIFCPRQCALSYIERVWEENLLTAEGGIMHDRAHKEKIETRDGVRIERGMPLRSQRLGLSGKTDVVEFHRSPDGKNWMPLPIEYKHGKPKNNNCDKVQLCAQAMCLEEMLGVTVPAGAIFYGKTRRRLDVEFNESLRRETENTARDLHEFIDKGITPKPVYEKKCDSCSLITVCMPETFKRGVSVKGYIEKMLCE